MWRILLLLLFFFTVTLMIQAKGIDDELKAIEQENDKNIVVVQLEKLLKNVKYNNIKKIKILIKQGYAYLALSDLPNALRVIKQAKALIAPEELSLQQAEVDKLMGIVCYFQGQYDSSLLSYQAALEYFQKQSFSEERELKKAHLFNNIALVQTTKGNPLAALKAYQEADSLYQLYGDAMDKVDVRYNLAVLYLSLRRYDIAIDMFKEVIVKKKLLKDEHGIAKASAGAGVSFKQSGEYEKAERYVLEALDYFKKNNYHIDTASQLHNLAEINYELSYLDKAYDYAILGAEMSKEIGHKMTYGGSLHTLAKIFFFQGDIELSREYLEQSNDIAKEMGFKQLINGNLALKSLIYAADGETSKALTTQLSYQKERLKLSNETLNEQIFQFESVQLNQQIKALQQSKQLQILESAKADQQQQLIVLLVVFLSLILFLIYRRYLEVGLTKKLENSVKDRTKALEFLTKELQEANTIKSQFLANMSHEIRTPLTAVLGQAEAIIYGDFDEASLIHEVGIIHNNSLHLLQLINDILDLSKIEANKFELENRRQNLHEIVDQLNDMFTEQAQRKNLSFTVSHHLPSPFIIDIDGLRLKQILINLCSNGIKFTSEGWVSLDIAIINKTLLFTVTDTGIGMNKKQMAKMFNIFTQGDNSISRRFSGSGLGLFLSEQLANAMSGNITVTSELNHGSTFVLKLPFGEVYHALDKVENSDSTVNLKTHKKQYIGKVLLAEDHDDNRRLIARLLKSIGLEVIEASNGIEAVELCIEHQPELILLDIQMPKMDGIQVLEELRQRGCTQPMYALTANAMSHEISQYLALGFAGHLKKPIEREIFITTIVQHCIEKDNSKNKDYETLSRIAHKISGAAQMFGFTEISESAAELENTIKKQKEAYINDLTHCLLDEITLAENNYQASLGLSD